MVHVGTVSVANAADDDSGSGDPSDDDAPSGPGGPFRGFRMPRDPRFGGGEARRGAGSGFIIRKDGVILTNNHVVEHAKEITVALSDGRKLPAKVLGRDPKTDLAVLKIDSKEPLAVVQLGDSDGLSVGDWVVAIGNPFGLDNTVTAGIVSAKGRAIGQGPYDHFIQTDASINPGNSGGPLFDERGNVVGINTAIFSQSGGNIGIGFAIPINMAKELVPELEEKGHVTRGLLGVSIQKLTPELAESMGTDGAQGALVAGVTADSPAAKAGVQPGDVIHRWDGKSVDEPGTLSMLVAGTPIGKTVPVELSRDGKSKDVEVTVAKLADDETASDDGACAPRQVGSVAARADTGRAQGARSGRRHRRAGGGRGARQPGRRGRGEGGRRGAPGEPASRRLGCRAEGGGREGGGRQAAPPAGPSGRRGRSLRGALAALSRSGAASVPPSVVRGWSSTTPAFFLTGGHFLSGSLAASLARGRSA